MIATDKLKMYAAYVPDSMEEWDWDPETYSKILLRDMALELMAAREVVEASRVGSFHHPACPYFDGAERCGCSNQLVKDALKAYDEARRE